MKLLSAISRGVVIASVLVLVPACGPRYNKKSLKPLTSVNADYQETKKDVTVRAKKMSSKEVLTLFNNRGNEIFENAKNQIHAVQLSCLNQSDTVYTIDKKSIGIPLVQIDTLYKKMAWSPGAQVTGVVLGGVGLGIGVTAANAYLLSTGIFFSMPLVASIAGLTAGFVPYSFLFGLPYLCYSLAKQGKTANEALEKDLNKKTVGDCLAISPKEQKDWLIFITQKDFTPSFFLTCSSLTNNDLVTFNINLMQKNNCVWHIAQ